MDLSIDKHGFPDSLPALSACEEVREKFDLAKLGFQTSVIVTPDGITPLATAGASSLESYGDSIQWNAERFREFLSKGNRDFEELKTLLLNPRLTPQQKQDHRDKIRDGVHAEYWESSDAVAVELTGKPVPR